MNVPITYARRAWVVAAQGPGPSALSIGHKIGAVVQWLLAVCPIDTDALRLLAWLWEGARNSWAMQWMSTPMLTRTLVPTLQRQTKMLMARWVMFATAAVVTGALIHNVCPRWHHLTGDVEVEAQCEPCQWLWQQEQYRMQADTFLSSVLCVLCCSTRSTTSTA